MSGLCQVVFPKIAVYVFRNTAACLAFLLRCHIFAENGLLSVIEWICCRLEISKRDSESLFYGRDALSGVPRRCAGADRRPPRRRGGTPPSGRRVTICPIRHPHPDSSHGSAASLGRHPHDDEGGNIVLLVVRRMIAVLRRSPCHTDRLHGREIVWALVRPAGLEPATISFEG